jgi:hypothetical protein
MRLGTGRRPAPCACYREHRVFCGYGSDSNVSGLSSAQKCRLDLSVPSSTSVAPLPPSPPILSSGRAIYPPNNSGPMPPFASSLSTSLPFPIKGIPSDSTYKQWLQLTQGYTSCGAAHTFKPRIPQTSLWCSGRVVYRVHHSLERGAFGPANAGAPLGYFISIRFGQTHPPTSTTNQAAFSGRISTTRLACSTLQKFGCMQ